MQAFFPFFSLFFPFFNDDFHPETKLSWAEIAGPSQGAFCFAPNMTPITFNEPPALVDQPDGYDGPLFPVNDCPSTRKQPHSKKKPEGHVPRPPNAFILFRSSFIKSQHVSTDIETNHSTLSKIIGLTWQNLPLDERQIWHAKARAALDEHKRKFPKYAFRPTHPKGKAPEKRKVREVGPKDLKRCAKIAELLVEGKKGHELDEAIQEFDRHHIPEIVTRFEEPITARAYRRSSSAPIPDTTSPRESSFPTKAAARKASIRSSSTQPTSPPIPPPTPSIHQHWSTPSPDYGSESFYDAGYSQVPTPLMDYSYSQSPSPSFVSPFTPVFMLPPNALNRTSTHSLSNNPSPPHPQSQPQ